MSSGATSEPRAAGTTWNGRPKHPRDWRWFVGGLGKVLITLGVLMFLFVAYQLWGTGLQTAAAQRDLRNQFEELLGSTSTATTAPSTTTPDTAPVDSGPAPTTVPPTTVPATVTPPPAIEPGAPMGYLEIPSIGADDVFVNGVSVDNLKDGPGHFPESVLPGQVGNTSIAGHRTTYGAPFFRVDEIRPGDQIIVTTLAGRFVYVATETLIIGADEFGRAVLDGVDGTATISLVSCHPRYTSRERIVVRGVIDTTLSTPLVGTTTTTPTPSTVPPTLPSESTPDTAANSVPDTTTTVVPVVPDGGPPEAGEDSFSRGWFSDAAAWPQVLLWGLACAAVALGAYGVSRLARRNWVGAIAGLVPMVLVLYFFFENVHRLLPPGI